MDWPSLLSAFSFAIGAISGIVGTVLGTLAASSNARKMAEDRMRQEDRTRFHDKKLGFYAEFIQAAEALGWAEEPIDYGAKYSGEKERLMRVRNVALDRFNLVLTSVTLVGGKEVREAANKVSVAFYGLSQASEASIAAREEAGMTYYARVADAREAMREELQPPTHV